MPKLTGLQVVARLKSLERTDVSPGVLLYQSHTDSTHQKLPVCSWNHGERSVPTHCHRPSSSPSSHFHLLRSRTTRSARIPRSWCICRTHQARQGSRPASPPSTSRRETNGVVLGASTCILRLPRIDPHNSHLQPPVFLFGIGVSDCWISGIISTC